MRTRQGEMKAILRALHRRHNVVLNWLADLLVPHVGWDQMLAGGNLLVTIGRPRPRRQQAVFEAKFEKQFGVGLLSDPDIRAAYDEWLAINIALWG